MPTLGFVNQVSDKHVAAYKSYEQLRKYYPDSPVIFTVDGEENHDYYGNISYNLHYRFNVYKIGYPPYTKEKILSWLTRLHTSVNLLDTDYFMMLEDDVLIIDHITLDQSIEYLSHDVLSMSDDEIRHHTIPEILMNEIENFSGKKQETNFYTCGGASIFKTNTFLINYKNIYEYIDANWDLYFKHYYPQTSFMDCYMSIFYMLSGKKYTPNKKLLNLNVHTHEGRELINNGKFKKIEQLYKTKYEIIHGVKYYYGHNY